jgi:hypothetical protein
MSFSAEAIIALVGVFVTLPPFCIIVWKVLLLYLHSRPQIPMLPVTRAQTNSTYIPCWYGMTASLATAGVARRTTTRLPRPFLLSQTVQLSRTYAVPAHAGQAQVIPPAYPLANAGTDVRTSIHMGDSLIRLPSPCLLRSCLQEGDADILRT